MERRRSPRLPVQLHVEARSDDQSMNGITVNLSLTGACILLEGAPAEFGTIELTITFPLEVEGTTEKFEVEFPGVVVRTEPTDSRTVVAVMFQKLPVESEWALSKFILAQFDSSAQGA